MATTPKIQHFADISFIEHALMLVEPRSFLLAVVFLTVSFILAYLTNPSEASFRTHLTELAFRRHLSRFYDADTDIENHQHESTKGASGLHIAAKRQPALTKHPSSAHLTPFISSSQHPSLRSPKQSSNNHGDVTATTQVLSASDGFHFANKATIGMRTPGHVFRSLGLCTIAAIPIVSEDATTAPITAIATHKSGRASDPESPSIGKDSGEEVTLAGKWFIGAFGKWWLGGTLQLRQQAVTPGNHRNPNKILEKGDRFAAGVLSFRALDLDPITEGLVKNVADSFSAIAGKVHKATVPSVSSGSTANGNVNTSPHSRNPRTGRRNSNASAAPNLRSSSPPPLPKSASLPLHSARAPGSPIEHQNTVRSKPAATPAATVTTSHTNNITLPIHPTERTSQHSICNKPSSGSLKLPGVNHAHSTTNLAAPAASPPVTLSPNNTSHVPVTSTVHALDSLPIIIDILSQLHASREDAADSRNQLSLYLSSSQAIHEQLEESLNASRETKRREDSERAEMKGRLKSLEDAKRNADAVKREAEKRLRTALTTRDRVSNRVAQLGKNIDDVQKKMQSYAGKVDESATWREEQSAQLRESMEKARKEIKVTEDVIAALVLRAKELEEQIQEERIAFARVEAEVVEKRRGRPTTATTPGTTPPSVARSALPLNDDLNHPIILRPQQQKSPVALAAEASFSLAESVMDCPSPAASLAAPSGSSTLPLYQRRHPTHEPDALNLSPGLRGTGRHRHTLSLTGNDDVILSLGHGHTSSHSSSSGVPNGNGKLPSPIGSPPSISIPSSVSSLEDSPGSRVSRPLLPNGRPHFFSPFTDASPISPFTPSLIPSSLLSSLEENGSVRTSPTSVGMEDFTLSYPLGRQSHRNSSANSGPTLGAPFVWQRPSPVESISRQPWDECLDSANVTPYGSARLASTDILYASPPGSRSSFGATSADFPVHSPAALSSESLYRSDPEPVQPATKWRWFHSGFSVPGSSPSPGNMGPTVTPPKTRKESTLNPDAKVFRFTRGRSFAFPTRGGGIGSASGTPDGGNMVHGGANAVGDGRPRGSSSAGSLNAAFAPSAPMPPPSTNPTSFLSSLLAFTPSAEERAALQRALGHNSAGGINPTWNSSAERLGSDHSSLAYDYPQSGHQVSTGSARSSHVDLTSAAGPIWADLYLPSHPKQHQPCGASADGNAPPPTVPPVTNSVQSKRTFSSLWNRKKSNGALGVNNPGAPSASAEDI